MKMRRLFTVLFAFAAYSQASPIAILNSGFESPAGGIQNGVATGWNVSNGAAGTWDISPPSSFFNAAAPEGNQVLFVGFLGSAADVSQTLTDTVQPNTTYTLSFFLGRRLDLALSTYSVSLEANGVTVLGSDSAGSPTAGDFVSRSIVFNSGANPATTGQNLGIFIHASGLGALEAGAQAEFDAFSLDASPTATGLGTPEPVPFVLLGSGIAAIMLSRRRLQKSS